MKSLYSRNNNNRACNGYEMKRHAARQRQQNGQKGQQNKKKTKQNEEKKKLNNNVGHTIYSALARRPVHIHMCTNEHLQNQPNRKLTYIHGRF